MKKDIEEAGFLRGLRHAQDIAWQAHKHYGREDATAYQVFETIRKFADENESYQHIEGYGIWIVGHDAYPVAVFRYEEDAEHWARDNYFGQWLMKHVPFPLVPSCTEAERLKAHEWATEMAAVFKSKPIAE